MKILSIQSSVAYGHVGNSAAVFPLQRLGHEVWPVLTVHFSNHTGYGAWRGPLLAADDVREVIAGIEDRGVLGQADAVLSGYQGDPAVGAIILDTVARVKELNPDAVYCCDPVMGDVGRGMFVRPGIPEFMRDTVVPQADIVTPNHFELDFLAGRETRTLDDILDAVDEVRERGPRDVLVTSVIHGDVPEGRLDMVAVSDEGAWAVETPAAADHAERLRRRHRGALPRAPALDRVCRDRAGPHHVLGVRDPREDHRGRHPRDPAGRCPGRDRGPAGALRGTPAALSSSVRLPVGIPRAPPGTPTTGVAGLVGGKLRVAVRADESEILAAVVLRVAVDMVQDEDEWQTVPLRGHRADGAATPLVVAEVPADVVGRLGVDERDTGLEPGGDVELSLSLPLAGVAAVHPTPAAREHRTAASALEHISTVGRGTDRAA